jgi:mono/diheme cytochrome c family protein
MVRVFQFYKEYLFHSFYVTILLVFYLGVSCNSDSQRPLTDGKSLYKQYCVNCHGIDGSLRTNGAIDLRYSVLSLEEKMLVISKGRNVMTAFEKQLSPEQIIAVANYTEKLKQAKEK